MNNKIFEINQHFNKDWKITQYNYDETLYFSEIKDIKLSEIKNNTHWVIEIKENIVICENDYYFLDIKKISNSLITFKITGIINPKKWNSKLFVIELKKILRSILGEQEQLKLKYYEAENRHEFEFEICIDENYSSKTIKEAFKRYIVKKIDLIYERVTQKLNIKFVEEELQALDLQLENFSKEKINIIFNFPKQLRDVCKQYLSYFGKFLLDNNIDCELSFIDKDDITYMIINVDESKIDNKKLKQALAGYFALPIVAQENINFDTYNIATQQLIANIEHLKSQLRLANLTITQYENNSLSTSQKPIEYVLVDSLDEDSKLKLYDGLVKVSKVLKLKFFGIEIELNIPKLINKFKNNSEETD